MDKNLNLDHWLDLLFEWASFDREKTKASIEMYAEEVHDLELPKKDFNEDFFDFTCSVQIICMLKQAGSLRHLSYRSVSAIGEPIWFGSDIDPKNMRERVIAAESQNPQGLLRLYDHYIQNGRDLRAITLNLR